MRSAQSQATNAATTAGDTASQYQSAGEALSASMNPILQRRATTEHGFTPDQLNELLTAAGAGTGGATGAFDEKAELEAARTGNTAGLSSQLDALARGKQQAMAGASEDIAGQDVMQAKQENTQALQEMGQLYGTDVDAAVKAMGVQTGDINAEIAANKTGWLQNMTELMQSLGQDAAGAGSIMKGLG